MAEPQEITAQVQVTVTLNDAQVVALMAVILKAADIAGDEVPDSSPRPYVKEALNFLTEATVTMDELGTEADG